MLKEINKDLGALSSNRNCIGPATFQKNDCALANEPEVKGIYRKMQSRVFVLFELSVSLNENTEKRRLSGRNSQALMPCESYGILLHIGASDPVELGWVLRL